MREFSIAFLLLLAINLSAQAIFTTERGNNVWRYAEATITYQEMFDYLGETLAVWRKEGNVDADLIELYRQTALVYKRQNNYPSALAYLDTCFILQKEFSGYSLTNQARAEYLYGEISGDKELLGARQFWYDTALQTMKKAMASGDSLLAGKNTKRIQTYISQAAFVAAQNQDFARSKLLSASFYDYNQRYRNSLGKAISDQRLIVNLMAEGLSLQKQEHFREARAVYDQVLKTSLAGLEDNLSQNNVLILRGNLANSYIEECDFATGELLVRKLLSDLLPLTQSNVELQDRAVVTYGYLLNALRGQGKYEEMSGIYDAAIAVRSRIDSTEKGRNLGLLNTFMAEAASEQGDFVLADNYFDLAQNNFVVDPEPIGPARLPRIRGNTFYGQEDFLYFLTATREAFVRKANTGDDQALDYALAASRSIDTLLRRGVEQLSLTSSIGSFLRLENRNYQRGIDLALRLYRERGKEEYLAEAFGFASVQKANLLRRYLGAQEIAESFGVPQALIGEKVRLETKVLILEKELNDSESSNKALLRQQLLNAQKGLTNIRQRLKEEFPAFDKAVQVSGLSNPTAAAASLTPDRKVIEYFLGVDSIYIFSLSAANGLSHAVVPRPKNLKDMVKKSIEDSGIAASLFQLLVAPILNSEDVNKRLQFIPDGILWNIPFAALRVNDEYLIERQAVSYSYSSATLFAAEQSTSPNTNYLGYGISYDDVIKRINSMGNRSVSDKKLRNMGPLPYARREISEVATLFNATPTLDQEVTVNHFLQTAPKGGILHLAMHGIMEKNPMKSALIFQSQASGMYDLLKMSELLGKDFPANLTVLSACHSGNGPLEISEGRQSIGRAFTAAGSKATITSNWAAPDQSTYLILRHFFDKVEAGLPTDEALREGILHFLDESSAAESAPVNWAHLTLTGSVEPVKQQRDWLRLVLLVTAACATLWGILKWRRTA